MNRQTHILSRRAVLGCSAVAAALSMALAALLLHAAPAAAATACESLTALGLSNAKIDSAQVVAAGAFVQPGRGGAPRGGGADGRGAAAPAGNARGGRGGGGAANAFAGLPAFCRIAATLTPTSD